MHRLTLLIVVLTLSFLAGCGQSGPLYLPGDPSTMVEPAAAPADPDADEDSGEAAVGETDGETDGETKDEEQR